MTAPHSPPPKVDDFATGFARFLDQPSQLQLKCNSESLKAVSHSMDSLAAAFDPSGPKTEAEHLFAELVSRFLDRSNDGSDLFRCKLVGATARGTFEFVSFEILPSQRYIELVSLIANEREDVSLVFSHGWPILSVGCGDSTVAELPAAGNGGGQGGAA